MIKTLELIAVCFPTAKTNYSKTLKRNFLYPLTVTV